MARGDLGRSPGLGKRIAKLPYEVVQIDGFDPVRVEIEVFMSKRFLHSESAPKPVSGATFHLRCEGEGVDGSDIDACISAMRSKLDKRLAIKWKNWLRVRVEKSRFYGYHEGSGIELKWDRVERGAAFDGSDLMRKFVGRDAKTWEIKPWPKYFKDDRGKTLACIPETPENLAALEAFKEKIDEMRKVLANFVSPDQIEDTLRSISEGRMNLLPKQ